VFPILEIKKDHLDITDDDSGLRLRVSLIRIDS